MPGYAVSQQKRKRVEEVFGWVKTVALLRKTRHRGVRRVGWLFTLGGRAVQPGADPEPDRGRGDAMSGRPRPPDGPPDPAGMGPRARLDRSASS